MSDYELNKTIIEGEGVSNNVMNYINNNGYQRIMNDKQQQPEPSYCTSQSICKNIPIGSDCLCNVDCASGYCNKSTGKCKEPASPPIDTIYITDN